MSCRCCTKESLRLFGSMRAGIVLLEYGVSMGLYKSASHLLEDGESEGFIFRVSRSCT